MAKKSSARERSIESDTSTFNDDAYEGVQFSATFDYGELSLSRAAAMLSPRGKNLSLGISVASLGSLLAVALTFQDNVIYAIPLLALSIVTTSVTSSWGKHQLRYARRTSLAPQGVSERRHVVVCDDAVHTEFGDGRAPVSYPLSALRCVYATDEQVVAGFARGQYVYVPRSAMSEGRFRSLVRFLHERAPQKEQK